MDPEKDEEIRKEDKDPEGERKKKSLSY